MFFFDAVNLICNLFHFSTTTIPAVSIGYIKVQQIIEKPFSKSNMNQNARQPGGICAHPCRGSQQQRGSASSAALCTKAVGVINKITSADDAIKLVQPGNTVFVSGFATGTGAPEELLVALEKRWLQTGSPNQLTVLFTAGPGHPPGEKGLNRLAREGLLKRAVGAHYGLSPKLAALAQQNKIEAYSLPLGVLHHMLRAAASRSPGVWTRVGLGTYVDSRREGGKVNERTTEDIVSLTHVEGKEYLFYKCVPINVAFVRGTTADPDGNVTVEKEAIGQDILAAAIAARNNGGIVICQVERIAERGSLPARQVKLPGVLVDAIVVATNPDHHTQNYKVAYNPAFSAELKVPLTSLPPLELDERKIIARRAAMELHPNDHVNLGIGMPEGVASVANEERIFKYFTLSAETGVIGGIPAGGWSFGAATNHMAMLDLSQQFDLYDGGGLQFSCLGLAECDEEGNINVSRFGPRLVGPGGFINISQNAKKVAFLGTFTAGGLEIAIEDGKLRIVKEGKNKKFVKRVNQVTFSGRYGLENGQTVLYITERCVFRLRPGGGLVLTEIAPGIDLQKDILDQMGFKPHICSKLRLMDSRIFSPHPIGLKKAIASISLKDRVSYDPHTETMFLDFSNMELRSLDDVKRIEKSLVAASEAIGTKYNLVVDYDGFSITEDDVLDAYSEFVGRQNVKYVKSAVRYTSSAFKQQLRFSQALQSLGVEPNMVEKQQQQPQPQQQVRAKL